MKSISKKAQQFESILLVIALITSVFAVGLYTGDESNKITGAVVAINEGEESIVSPEIIEHLINNMELANDVPNSIIGSGTSVRDKKRIYKTKYMDQEYYVHVKKNTGTGDVPVEIIGKTDLDDWSNLYEKDAGIFSDPMKTEQNIYTVDRGKWGKFGKSPGIDTPIKSFSLQSEKLDKIGGVLSSLGISTSTPSTEGLDKFLVQIPGKEVKVFDKSDISRSDLDLYAGSDAKVVEINSELAGKITANPEDYTIDDDEILLITDVGSDQVEVKKLDNTGKIIRDLGIQPKSEDYSLSASGTSVDSYKIGTEEYSIKEINFILKESKTSISDLTTSNKKSLAKYSSENKISRDENGILSTTAYGGNSYLIPQGESVNIYGQTFKAPIDSELKIQHTGGNTFKYGSTDYVLINHKLISKAKVSGKYESINPNGFNEINEIISFDPSTRIVGGPVSSSTTGIQGDYLKLNIGDSTVDFPMKGMSEAQKKAIVKMINEGEVGTLAASDGEISLETTAGETVTITHDSIVYENTDGDKTREVTYEGKKRIKLEKTFDKDEIKTVKILGSEIPISTFNELEDDIIWDDVKTSGSKTTIKLSDNRKVEIKGDDSTFYKNDIKTKLIETYSIGYDETKYDSDGVTKVSFKEVERSDDGTKTSTKEKHYSAGTVDYITYEAKFKDGDDEVKVNVKSNEDEFDDNTEIKINGNLIKHETLRLLSNDEINEFVDIFEYDEMPDINNIILEAKGYGIDIKQASAKYNPGRNRRELISEKGDKSAVILEETLILKEFAKDPDSTGYLVKIAKRTTKKDDSVVEFNCKEIGGCDDLPGSRITEEQFSSIYYNEKTNVISKTVSNIRKIDGEDPKKTVIDWGTPSDPLKDSYIKKLEYDGNPVLSLEKPDDDGYQKIFGEDTYYKDGKILKKETVKNFLGKSKVDFVESTDPDDIKKMKLILDSGAEGADHKGKIKNKESSFYQKQRTLASQKYIRSLFSSFESILTDFSGFGALNLLFRDEEWYFNWREGVDRAFAELYLGEEYWTSAVCASHVDRDQEGVAYLDTRLGLGGVAAHIEATRSEEIIKPAAGSSPAGSEFLYKITFHVKNGDWDRDPKSMEELKFNVFLYGERSARLLAKNIVLERGDDFGFTGAEAIVQFSDFHYSEICLEFDEAPWFWTLDDDELCNAIIGPSGPSSIGSGSASAEDQQAATEQEKTGGDVLDI